MSKNYGRHWVSGYTGRDLGRNVSSPWDKYGTVFQAEFMTINDISDWYKGEFEAGLKGKSYSHVYR